MFSTFGEGATADNVAAFFLILCDLVFYGLQNNMQEITALGFHQPYILSWKFQFSLLGFYDGFLPNSHSFLSLPA